MLDYYATPNVRELCHAVKQGNAQAIDEMAAALALHVSSNDVLTPVPNRHGVPGVIGDLCERIAALTGCTIWDGVRGQKRASHYDIKKSGLRLHEDQLAFHLIDSLPSLTGKHFVVDAIKDTGLTIRAATNLIPNAEPLTFAVVDKEEQALARVLLNASDVSCDASLALALSNIDDEGVAFSFVYQALHENESAEPALIDTLKSVFPRATHAGLVGGIEKGFAQSYGIKPNSVVTPPPEEQEKRPELPSLKIKK